MSKELDVQAKIIKSVRKDGGYGRKLSNRFVIGIPDLLIGLAPFAPCLAECKDLGEVVDKFNLKVDVTEKQGHELKLFDDVYFEKMTIYTPNKHASLVLVAIKHRGSHRLVALSHGERRLDHTYEGTPERWVERGVGGYYNIRPLLTWAGIINVKPM